MPEYIERELLPERKEYWDDDFGGGWDACLEEIAKLPAADVRPVVRGKWVQVGGSYTNRRILDGRILSCSGCGKLLNMLGVNGGRGDAHFCPNCGADMRGGEQDGRL